MARYGSAIGIGKEQYVVFSGFDADGQCQFFARDDVGLVGRVGVAQVRIGLLQLRQQRFLDLHLANGTGHYGFTELLCFL